jgi:hypothetical protein
MFIGWSYTRFLFLALIGNPTWLPLPSFGSFGKAVSEDKIFRNRPIRNKNCLWQPYLLMDRDEMSNLYRGPPIDASYQVRASMEGPLWELLILF